MWKLSQGRKQCKLQNHMEVTFIEYQALLWPCLSLNLRPIEDLLCADVVQHKSKYQEEIKSDQRPQMLVHGSSCSEVALQTMFLCLLNLILQINSSLKLIETWGICYTSPLNGLPNTSENGQM